MAAGLSQRALADATGISQSTLSRVISGQRAAKVPELMAIGWATGVTVAELAGTGTVADRAEGAARATNHADMDGMREALLRSTLAHELGHVLFEDWAGSDAGDWSDRNPAEIRADAFARHLLVPAEGLRDFIGDQSSVGVSTLSSVVQRFLISPPIAAIALCQAEYIDEATKQGWNGRSRGQIRAS